MVLGFYGKYWRRGNLNDTHEWSLAGRRLGTTLVFFLIGADIYTGVAFVANSRSPPNLLNQYQLL